LIAREREFLDCNFLFRDGCAGCKGEIRAVLDPGLRVDWKSGTLPSRVP
jgi:hypothetical protein